MAYLTQFKGKVLNGGEITALENPESKGLDTMSQKSESYECLC